MAYRFSVQSPLGYTVFCTDSQWLEHVLVAHPNMLNKELLVTKTILEPVAVYQSKEFPYRDVYFGITENTNVKLKYCKVIVQIELGNTAELVTAWQQPNISGNLGVVKFVKL